MRRQIGKVSHRNGKKAAVDQQKLQQKNPSQGGSFARGSWTEVGAQCVCGSFILSVKSGEETCIFSSDVSILVSDSFLYSAIVHIK